MINETLVGFSPSYSRFEKKNNKTNFNWFVEWSFESFIIGQNCIESFIHPFRLQLVKTFNIR